MTTVNFTHSNGFVETLTVTSASWGNAAQTAIVLETVESGQIVVTSDNPAWMQEATSKVDVAAFEAPPLQDRLLEVLAQKRWEHEQGGIVFSGVSVPTDDRSKLLINGAVSQALLQDDPDFTRTFKLNGQFTTLTNEQVIDIGLAIADHVQFCFDAEAVVALQIANGDVTDAAGVAAAFYAAYDAAGDEELQS